MVEGATVKGQVRLKSVPVENAVVYLAGMDPSRPPAPLINLTIIQKDLSFRPAFGVVTVGSTIRFENHDKEMHNVKSRSPGNRFDLGAHLPGGIKKVVLKKTGAVLLKCSIHDAMQAVLFVAPSIYFSVTDRFGRFEIRDVPEGPYRGEVWTPRLTPQEVKSHGRVLQVSSKNNPLKFDLNPSAPPGASLFDVADKDWGLVLEEMNAGLTQARLWWMGGKGTKALIQMLTVHSKLFGQSGLKNAISERLGISPVNEHDRVFNLLIKGIQKKNPTPGEEAAWEDQKEKLLNGLKTDVQKLRRVND